MFCFTVRCMMWGFAWNFESPPPHVLTQRPSVGIHKAYFQTKPNSQLKSFCDMLQFLIWLALGIAANSTSTIQTNNRDLNTAQNIPRRMPQRRPPPRNITHQNQESNETEIGRPAKWMTDPNSRGGSNSSNGPISTSEPKNHLQGSPCNLKSQCDSSRGYQCINSQCAGLEVSSNQCTVFGKEKFVVQNIKEGSVEQSVLSGIGKKCVVGNDCTQFSLQLLCINSLCSGISISSNQCVVYNS